MTDPTHKCPSPGCNVQVARSRFACLEHWRALPESDQRAITSAKIDSRPHAIAMLEAQGRLREMARRNREGSP